jgi:phosphoribosylamine-glycine ligase
LIFYAGTKLIGEDIVTAGGRVFTVVGLGETLQDAVDIAYAGVKSITFPGMFYRKDIAHRSATFLPETVDMTDICRALTSI